MRRAETAGTAVMVGTEEETEAEEREVEVASRVEMAEVIQVPPHRRSTMTSHGRRNNRRHRRCQGSTKP